MGIDVLALGIDVLALGIDVLASYNSGCEVRNSLSAVMSLLIQL